MTFIACFKRLHTFSCEEAGLVCDPYRQADSHLLPWCCTHNYNYVVAVVDQLADRYGANLLNIIYALEQK